MLKSLENVIKLGTYKYLGRNVFIVLVSLVKNCN